MIDAWRKFIHDFKVWQEQWNKENPDESKIINDFLEKEEDNKPKPDPSDWWKE